MGNIVCACIIIDELRYYLPCEQPSSCFCPALYQRLLLKPSGSPVDDVWKCCREYDAIAQNLSVRYPGRGFPHSSWLQLWVKLSLGETSPWNCHTSQHLLRDLLPRAHQGTKWINCHTQGTGSCAVITTSFPNKVSQHGKLPTAYWSWERNDPKWSFYELKTWTQISWSKTQLPYFLRLWTSHLTSLHLGKMQVMAGPTYHGDQMRWHT